MVPDAEGPDAADPDRPHSPLNVLDTVLQIGLVALLVYASSRIVLPFTNMLLWSAILAVVLYPLHRRLAARIGNRGSAVLIGVVGVLLMLLPMLMVVASLGNSITFLVSNLQANGLVLPPPPARLADLPLVGQKISEAWTLVSTNMPEALAKYRTMLSGPTAWFLSFAGGLVAGQFSFLLSFMVAAVVIAHGDGAAEFARRLLERVTRSKARGTRLVALTAATIRGVALGVVGVAAIQALLIGIGFFAIGLPAAGLWTLATLLLAIVQVPAILLTLPIIGYVFATEPTTPAIIFLVWTLIAGLSDNVLKPLMLGRGLEIPMPVILIGVIGGMVADGLLGLFMGPVVLAVGYVLLVEWLRQHRGDGCPRAEAPPP